MRVQKRSLMMALLAVVTVVSAMLSVHRYGIEATFGAGCLGCTATFLFLAVADRARHG